MSKDMYLVLEDGYPCGNFNVVAEGGAIPENVCSLSLDTNKKLDFRDPVARMAHYSAREVAIKEAENRGISFVDNTIYARS